MNILSDSERCEIAIDLLTENQLDTYKMRCEEAEHKINEEEPQIGDGKFPNKFWLSICNDYYYFDVVSNVSTWISDLNLFKCESETLDIYDTYEEAKKAADELELGQQLDGIVVNCIHIEDRLSGEVYERCQTFHPETATIGDEEHEDMDFTNNRQQEYNELGR